MADLHEVMDLRGVLSPWALLNVRAAYKGMSPNDCLEIVVGDVETKDDVLLVLSGALCEVAQGRTANSGSSVFRIRARKTSQP